MQSPTLSISISPNGYLGILVSQKSDRGYLREKICPLMLGGTKQPTVSRPWSSTFRVRWDTVGKRC